MQSSTAKKLAKRIEELRIARGLTQEEAAKKSGINYKYYQEHEGNKPRDMRVSTLERIAKTLDVSLSELVDLDE